MSIRTWLVAWVKLLRPQEYVKNVLVFTPMFFGRRWELWAEMLEGFVIFCIAASSVYALNDASDALRDRLHPIKKNRPVASGVISRPAAYMTAFLLGSLSLLSGFSLAASYGFFLLLYLANNVLYNLLLRRLPLWDVFSISAGFLLRIYAGAAIGDIPVSGYLFLTVFFLSLFLAFGKRRYERLLLGDTATSSTRKSLEGYPVYYLDQLMNISATLTLTLYGQYLLQGNFTWLMGTLPIVVMGIFRYYHLTHQKNAGEPTRELLSDPLLLGLGALYALFAAMEMQGVPFPY